MSDLIDLRVPVAEPRGFAILAKGFRPLFLGAGVFAVLGVPLWILVRANVAAVGDHLLPSVWHAHEMVFGFAAAVVAGFLLTAASNWTKRVTAVGPWLGLICVTWVAARLITPLGGVVPGWVIAAINLSFPPMIVIAIGRPIVAAGSKRNYGLVIVLLALFAAQAMTHYGALSGSVRWQTLGPRLGVGLVTVIVLVIGGRIIPIFTRNATGAEGIRTIRWLDVISIASAVGVVLMDVFMVRGPAFTAVAGVAGVASLLRARHWGFRASLPNSLLWILHIGYLFVPLGFALRALAQSVPAITDSTALHALTAGAIGVLILGMMTRVSLGHTGRPLKTPPVLTLAFVFVVLAASIRIVGPMLPGVATPAMYLAAALWSVGYSIYLVRIGPMLCRPRPDGRPG